MMQEVLGSTNSLLSSHHKVEGLQYYGWNGFKKCAVEMGSCGKLYIPSSIKIGPRTQVDIHTDSKVIP
jgi:hypothetical protein